MQSAASTQQTDTTETPNLAESRPADLPAALHRCAIRLDAAALLLVAPGHHLHRQLARDERAAALLAQLWNDGAAAFIEHSRRSTEPWGSNRIRTDPDGPIRGRLLAIGLRDAVQASIGVLAVLRGVEQSFFSTRDSRLLQQLAAEAAEIIATDHDAATGLLTRVAFERQARLAATESGRSGCVIYGDIDELHVRNKLHGFGAGDRAIAAVGAALRESKLPRGALACHLSGDRFTLYLPSTTLSQGRAVAAQLRRAAAARACAEGAMHPAALSVSFGVASVPAGSFELGHALAAAESACKAAKDRSRDHVEIYQDADASIVQRHDDVVLAARLREALEQERLEVLAQPIARLQGELAATHYELLVRIVSEDGVRMSPEVFLSAAMRYHLLPLLDRAVISRVFAILKDRRDCLEGRGLRFSLNLSGPTISDPDFLEWVAGSIGAQEVPGEWLQFELTEAAAVADLTRTQAMFRRLGQRGVHFALDDFGTGVSSLAYLQAFDVHMLKLHGSFVGGLMSNPRAESLVMGIAWLARTMGMETVAECVETEEVRERLAQLGVDRGQGYLFGRPAPLQELLASLPPRVPR